MLKLQILELRKQSGMTQQQLAERLGVTHQSVSKWENGVSMPDISMLPCLSEVFKVDVDIILGLKPLNNAQYFSKGTSKSDYWEEKLDYLTKSRALMWNDDYLEFLVTKVWRMQAPINVIDFGCGYGELGMKLMPFLPTGSTYTGIDFNEKLINEARLFFSNLSFQSDFVHADINDFSSPVKYDLAICQAFLRHLPNPFEMLGKMVDAVCDGGIVIAVEVNRGIENAGLFINGFDGLSCDNTATFQKLWKEEFRKEGRDYGVGMKIPFYMHQLGLRDIGSRLCDKVNYLRGNEETHKELLKAFIKTKGFEKKMTDKDREAVIALLLNRGISRQEAEEYLRSKESLRAYIDENKESLEIVFSMGLIISYGWKTII